MSKTYGDLPGVKVETGGSIAPSPEPDLSERELRLCVICIHATGACYIEDGMLMIDLEEAEAALGCYGYSIFESRPMLQQALCELGERVYPDD